MKRVLCGLCFCDCNQNANRVTKYTPFENELVFTGITFPMKIKDITKFEKLNLTISVNFFGYEESGIFPLCITDEVKEHHVNLLLISNEENSHYVLIRSMSRLVNTQRSNHHYTKFICNYCLHGFCREDLITSHMEYCKVLNKINLIFNLIYQIDIMDCCYVFIKLDVSYLVIYMD